MVQEVDGHRQLFSTAGVVSIPENFDNRLLDHEERIASIEKTISKAEKLLILIVGLQFPNLIESLSIAGII